jgi:hypothetical protein
LSKPEFIPDQSNEIGEAGIVGVHGLSLAKGAYLGLIG